MMAANYPFSVDGNEFQGKRVLVTGGTKGMGEAIARRLTLGGGSVATTARSPFLEGQQPALFDVLSRFFFRFTRRSAAEELRAHR